MKQESWFKGLTKSKVEELERKARAYDAHKSQEAQRPFVEALIRGMGTVLATTPFDRWPPEAKTVFHYVARNFPAGTHEYRKNLPQP